MYLCKYLKDYGFPESYNKTSKNDVLNFILSSKQSKSLISENTFSNLFKELYLELISVDFPKYFTFSQKLYHFLNDDKNLELELCKICGNKKKFLNFKVGYNKTCSKKCGRILMKNTYKKTCLEKYGVENYAQTNEYKKKFKKTCLDKFGCENPFQNENVKNKIKETNIKKYGVKNYSQTEEFLSKIKETNLEKFGVEYYSQTEESKIRIKETSLEKYGVENYAQTEECHNKMKKTCLERYGVEYYAQTKECIDKMKQTNLERYGVENYSQTDKCIDKIKETCIERYGVENYSQTNEFSTKRRKKILYDNISFDSSWEIIVYKYCKKHNLNFKYQPDILFTYTYDGIIHKYQPDFLIEDKLYEVKGDHFFENGKMICPFDRSKDELFEEKYKCMKNNNVIVLISKDIDKLKNDI